MKLWRYIFGVFLLTLCTLFALANNDIVMIKLPNILGPGSGKNIYIPIYLLTTVAVFFGVIVGLLIEYSRNFKLRKVFNENKKKLLGIEKELQKSRDKFLTEEEKIFNLLD